MTTTTLGDRIWVRIDPVQEREDSWSAFCDALQLASVGSTKDEAIRNLRAAIQSYAGVLRRKGMLSQIMAEKNIRVEVLTTDQEIPTDEIPVDILEESALIS